MPPLRHLLCVFVLLLAWLSEGRAQPQAGAQDAHGRSDPPAACRDTAPHKTRFDRFASGNPTPTVRLYGAPHYIYINNETEVVREMRKFLGLPVGGH